MKLNFYYEMTLTFDFPIKEQFFSLKIEPISDTSQRLYSYEKQILPCDYTCRELDWCGNVKYSGSSIAPHDFFGFVSTGTVFTTSNPVKSIGDIAVYRYPSWYTHISDSMVSFLNSIVVEHFNETLDTLQKATIVMDSLHKYLRYQPLTTSICTTASESFNLGVGVCQDYSHIFISLLRYLNVPTRYVSGLMYEDGTVRYGATHAWVEVYHDGYWFGYDPTNDCFINEGYIALAKGRDYNDCSVDRGLFKGNTLQQQYISISIKEV